MSAECGKSYRGVGVKSDQDRMLAGTDMHMTFGHEPAILAMQLLVARR